MVGVRSKISVNRSLWRFLSVTISCLLFVQASYAFVPEPTTSTALYATTPAEQAAEILSVTTQVDKLRLLQRQPQDSATNSELLSLRGVILRKILLALLQRRKACNKIDVELSYTYDVMRREKRKLETANELFNVASFSRLATFYTVEPFERINKQFKQATVQGLVSAGLAVCIPVMGMLYDRLSAARNTAPPKFLEPILDGGPVDCEGLPDLVDKFMNAREAGSSITRREELFALWKKRYHVDAANKATLCNINDGRGKSLGLLTTRIILLWSLRNTIQKFDPELLSLANLIKTKTSSQSGNQAESLRAAGFSTGAIEAAHLLNVQAETAELAALKRSGTNNERRRELETLLLERVVAGYLDVSIAVARVSEEMNFAYDVVLSGLLSKRGNNLQRDFELNFIQTGVFGEVAGTLFLKGHPVQGGELFLISSALDTTLSTLALLATHGGWRKIDGKPNSLADFFDLTTTSEYRFSPLVTNFLNSPSPQSKDGKSRKEELKAIWKQEHATSINLDSEKNRRKVSATPPAKYDSIKIVSNRIALLRSLRANLEMFDSDLFELLQYTDINDLASNQGNRALNLNQVATATARLLGVEAAAAALETLKNNNGSGNEIIDTQLSLTRRILSAMLEVSVMSDKLEIEITRETRAMDRMTQARDLGIAFTNNANFFQFGILGMIISGPLGLSTKPSLNLAGNKLNIVSGFLIGGLTLGSLVQQAGGFGSIRPNKAKPNLLGQCLGLDTPAETRYSPLIWNFLNTQVSETNKMTRREELLAYWKETKILSINLDNHATLEKVSAEGPSHHWYSESIKLIRNRLTMLFDVRVIVDLLDNGLSDLLSAID